MATKAQIAANRRNAARSTGPRTTDGKSQVRQNAVRHGLCARFHLIPLERAEDVETLLVSLREEHQPVDATEEILVFKMAEHFFNSRRAAYLLSKQINWAEDLPESLPAVALMLRYQAAADRGYYKALAELRNLQQERELQEIGFVSQQPETSDEPFAQPQPSPEAET